MQEIDNEAWMMKSMNYPLFVEEDIYGFEFEPHSRDYKLGKIHKKEWWPILRDHSKLVLLAPRDHLKSFFAVEAYTIWKLKHNPGLRVYIISKSDPQVRVRIDNIKKIIETSEELQWLKPAIPDDWSKSQIKCSNGASVAGAGYFSGHRGKHPHLLILDDPVEEDVIYSPELNQKYVDRFFMTILPMAEADTQVIIVGTRQCEGDLYDALKPPEWTTKTYRAVVNEEKQETLFPEKWPYEKLMQRKNEIVNSPQGGMRIWKKEYDNDVTSIKGNYVKYENIRFWLRPGEKKPEQGRWAGNTWLEIPEKIDIYTGWDLNVSKKPTADFTAGITIGLDRTTGNIFVLDTFRDRLSFPERIAAVKVKGEQFPRVLQVGIENVAFQDDTVQATIRESHLPIKGIKSTANKFTRLESVCTLFVNGKVYCRPDQIPFIEEVVSFPMGAHDDQLDAFDIAVLMARVKSRTQIIIMDEEPEALAIVESEQARKKQETSTNVTKIGQDEYIVMGIQVGLREGIVIRGPMWAHGRTLEELHETIIERQRGVVENNRMYDQIFLTQHGIDRVVNR